MPIHPIGSEILDPSSIPPEQAAGSRAEQVAGPRRAGAISRSTATPQLLENLQRIGISPLAVGDALSAADRPRATLPGSRQVDTVGAQQSHQVSPAMNLEQFVNELHNFHYRNLNVSLSRESESARKLSEPAFRLAIEAEKQLEKANRATRLGTVPGFIFQQKVAAAYNLVCTMPDISRRVEGLTLAGLDQLLDTDIWLNQVQEGVADVERVHVEVAPYRAVFEEALRRYGTASGIARPGADSSVRMAISGLAEALHQRQRAAFGLTALRALQLSAHEDGDWDDLNLALAPFRSFNHDSAQRMTRLLDLHQDVRVTLRGSEKQELASRIDILDAQIHSALLAGCKVEGDERNLNPVTFRRALLRFADAGRLLLTSLENIRNRQPLTVDIAAQFHGTTRLGQPTHRLEVLAEKDEAAEVAAMSRGTAFGPEAGPTQAASSSRAKGNKAHGTRRASNRPRSDAAETHTAAELSVVAELVRARLSAYPQPASLAADKPSELVAIGKRLGRDTVLLETIDNPDTDPLTASSTRRSAVESWFGAVPRWRAFHTQVVRDASIPKEQQTALLNSIEQRIAKIDTLLACIDTEELDRIKGFRIPTSAHVERLLVAKQVTSVSEVRLLPSGPDPERSTVFEVGIQPAPRSDGSEVPAIYLHLHTNEPITAKQCRLLPPKAFAASHLKSEEQRGYGKNWEDVQRQMGLDGAVYRGKTSDQLLKNLLRLTPSKLINALTTHGA